MDVQLKDLLEKIKEEGVKPAEEQAGAIIAEAEKKARQIVQDAQNKAEAVVAAAKSEAQKAERAGREAIKQAARDLLISLRHTISRLFDSIIRMEVEKSMSGANLENIIASLVKAWVSNRKEEINVLLSPADLEKLQTSLQSKLSAEMKKGVTLKPSSHVDAGFHIEEKDGSAYYNFSVQGIAELLSEFLNAKLADCIKEASAGGL